MRETLYFKDDDSRLSFLQGNYITLTNMKDKDFERIIRFHLAPINISVQTMNPKLRCRMLNNRFAGRALKMMDRLYEAGIPMNGQIVLCKGVNDGRELDFSIRELTRYIPYMQSVSVVPVGLSRYREGLYPLEPFTPEECGQAIDLIESWQRKIYEEHGIHFIHASDEFYMQAGRPLPEAERYDGYIQLENGVGMMRMFINEFQEELEEVLAKEAYPGIKRNDDSGIWDEEYKEDIFVGYRWVDKEKTKPLFPFGYGLSYTTFDYGKAKADKAKMSANGTITISVPVTNSGSRDGQEIVQLYISDLKSSLPRPVKELKAFKKVNVPAGKTVTVDFTIDKGALSFFDPEKHDWVAEPGKFEALIAASSADIRSKVSFELE